jgi:hypothetical protein
VAGPHIEVHGEVLTREQALARIAEFRAEGHSQCNSWQMALDPDRTVSEARARMRTAYYFKTYGKEIKGYVEAIRKRGKRTNRLNSDQVIEDLVETLEQVIDRGLQAAAVLDRRGEPVAETTRVECECGKVHEVGRAVWQSDGAVVVRAVHEIALLRSLIVHKSEKTSRGELDGKTRQQVLSRVEALLEELGLSREGASAARGSEGKAPRALRAVPEAS